MLQSSFSLPPLGLREQSGEKCAPSPEAPEPLDVPPGSALHPSNSGDDFVGRFLTDMEEAPHDNLLLGDAVEKDVLFNPKLTATEVQVVARLPEFRIVNEVCHGVG